MKHLVVLTGAGISADSGIKTFRDSGGLWEGHDVMQVASPDGWQENPELVLKFYNERRRQVRKVQPNDAHLLLHRLEDDYKVTIITQNIDDLHEKAGSSTIIHLHGEILKVRSVSNEKLIYDWEEDLTMEDRAEDGSPLRPHIVWFGEMVPKLADAIHEVRTADIFVIIGTSLQVYPAAILYEYAPNNTPIYYIDPKAKENAPNAKIVCIPKKAPEGVLKFYHILQKIK